MERSKCSGMLIIAIIALISFIAFPSSGQEGAKGERNEYIGSEACKECHPDLYEGFKKDNPHWRSILDPKVPPDKKGCESCHGAGERHAESEGKGFIFSFKDKTARDRSEPCFKCHQKEKEFFQFNRGVHKLSAVGCNDCHQIHGTRVVKNLLKEKESDLCFSCHADVKSKFYLPTRHRVLEGALKCSDCHTPHGTRTRASLRTWNKFNVDVCYKCHPEKRGPWVFEHLSVKAEGCTLCHTPHGSPNRFLLIRRDVRTVCLECHGEPHFPRFSCVNCHTQIHGSNFSSRFFQ
jgi:DmsE family decaheme c-type cytochrome